MFWAPGFSLIWVHCSCNCRRYFSDVWSKHGIAQMLRRVCRHAFHGTCSKLWLKEMRKSWQWTIRAYKVRHTVLFQLRCFAVFRRKRFSARTSLSGHD